MLHGYITRKTGPSGSSDGSAGTNIPGSLSTIPQAPSPGKCPERKDSHSSSTSYENARLSLPATTSVQEVKGKKPDLDRKDFRGPSKLPRKEGTSEIVVISAIHALTVELLSANQLRLEKEIFAELIIMRKKVEDRLATPHHSRDLCPHKGRACASAECIFSN